MFNTLVTNLTGFFSRSFWFGAYLPVAMVLALHLVIGQVVFPETIKLSDWLTGALASDLTVFSIWLFGTILLAYVLVTFVPLLRSILDGTSLPDQIHDGLRRGRAAEWLAASRRVDIALRLSEEFDKLKEESDSQVDAVAPGAAQPAVDADSIDKALKALAVWEKEMARLKLNAQTGKAACDALVAALSANAKPPDNLSQDERKKLDQLTDCRGRVAQALKVCCEEARYRVGRSEAQSEVDLEPTRVADARNRAERYCKDTYGVEFDFVWPRIQAIMQQAEAVNTSADSYGTRLADAQSQVTFSVLAFVLAFTVPIVWLPIILYKAASPWVFFMIGFASPVVLLLLYELIVQSQMVFGETVKATIDKYRLQVLTDSFLQPKPASLATERLLWEGLKAATEPLNQVNLAYVEAKGQANAAE